MWITSAPLRPCRTNKLLFHCCLEGLRWDRSCNEKKIQVMFPWQRWWTKTDKLLCRLRGRTSGPSVAPLPPRAPPSSYNVDSPFPKNLIQPGGPVFTSCWGFVDFFNHCSWSTGLCLFCTTISERKCFRLFCATKRRESSWLHLSGRNYFILRTLAPQWTESVVIMSSFQCFQTLRHSSGLLVWIFRKVRNN